MWLFTMIGVFRGGIIRIFRIRSRTRGFGSRLMTPLWSLWWTVFLIICKFILSWECGNPWIFRIGKNPMGWKSCIEYLFETAACWYYLVKWTLCYFLWNSFHFSWNMCRLWIFIFSLSRFEVQQYIKLINSWNSWLIF